MHSITKIIALGFLVCLFLYTEAGVAMAQEVEVVSQSAQLVTNKSSNLAVDFREVRLKNFLRKYNSPLEKHAGDFIYWADKYSIDWRLVPAITGVESTFGRRIPKNSYNAYGWANGSHKFGTWEVSIEVVTSALRHKYINKGADSIPKIARRWAPPSKTWASNVSYFINKIDATPVEFDI